MLNSYNVASFLIVFIIKTESQEYGIIRSTENGMVRGIVNTSQANNSTRFYAFTRVPYAQPPIGKLRFKGPTPSQNWTHIRNATGPLEICAQRSNSGNGNDAVGSEDCLYLQIFEAITARERHNESGSLAVMVWFHGGAFDFGNPSETEPDFLMEEPIVLVTVQYRLNVFGFLSTQDSSAAGNNGLKDQLFALKWVQRNIGYFGGDPNKVTIFGESAGSASVQYHILSPKSRGYFHRAIGQSGSSLNRWAYRWNPRKIAFKLGKGLGITTASSKKLIEHLQKVDYRALLLAASNSSVVGFYLPYYARPFVPSLEKKSEEAFLTKSMYESFRKGEYNKVPCMLGFNTEEGSYGYTYVHNGRVNISIYEEHPELLIPISMNIKKGSKCAKKVLNQTENYYFMDGNLTNPTSWIPYMSQDLFVRGISKSVDFIYKNAPVYFYVFSYIGEYSLGFIGGVGHYGEMHYLWYRTGLVRTPISSQPDLLTSRRMVTMWTDFARFGNPTPIKNELLQNVTWPKVNSDKPAFWIHSDLSVVNDPNKVNDSFWEKLFDLCGNPPYVTY